MTTTGHEVLRSGVMVSICVLIGAAIMVLAVPWIDFVLDRYLLNPFQWVASYFKWCEDRQRGMGRKL